MSNPPVDYYASLEIQPNATQQQVRDAYKRAALKHHPDRVPTDSPERTSRTKKFQQINDAYYTLSDPGRRKEYDAARRSFPGFGGFGGGGGGGYTADSDPEEEIPRTDNAGSGRAAAGEFPWSSFMGFGGRANSAEDEARFSNEQFGSVFEDMMQDEGLADGQNQPTSKFWSLVGGVSGGAMGFIVANLPGAIAGAVAGNRLGAIRDKKGKSVYAVYQELDQPERMRLLSELASKVFAHAIS